MDGIITMVALSAPASYSEEMTVSPAEEHELELTQNIDSKTFRQVHDLRVRYDADRVIVQGRSASYYVKQLATHAVLNLMPGVAIENRIDVVR
jgi:hypothetical protein